MLNKKAVNKSCPVFPVGKKAVSAIVGVSLLIMVTVVAVAVLWVTVVPLIRDSMADSSSEKVEISIETTGGYTTWDEVNKIARVQVKRGNDKVNLTGLDFGFLSEGETYKENRTDVPSKNQMKVYEFNLNEKISNRPEKVTIAPITSNGVGKTASESEVINNYTGPPYCNYDYTNWSNCNATGQKTRTVVSSFPSACVGNPVLVQSCNVLGEEKITNGDFTGSANGWTLENSWRYSDNSVSKVLNYKTSLLQLNEDMITPLVIGETYVLSFTVSNNSVGGMIVGLGGENYLFTNGNNDYTLTFTAGSTTDLVFKPLSEETRLTVDNVSLKRVND